MSEPKHAPTGAPLYAVSAEFGSPDAVVAAAHALRPRALGHLAIYSPVPVEGAADAIELDRRPIPYWLAIGAALGGFALMMGMCVYATAYDYVFIIGGRPLVSWPSFVVPSVSFAMLSGALVVFLGTIFLSRLPLLNHPAFNIPNFTRASQDRFFLVVASRDAAFDAPAVERALAGLDARPIAVHQVPR